MVAAQTDNDLMPVVFRTHDKDKGTSTVTLVQTSPAGEVNKYEAPIRGTSNVSIAQAAAATIAAPAFFPPVQIGTLIYQIVIYQL